MGIPTAVDTSPLKSQLNITGTAIFPASFVFAATAGSGVLTIYDGLVAADAIGPNLVATIPVNSTIQINFPVKRGIVAVASGSSAC